MKISTALTGAAAAAVGFVVLASFARAQSAEIRYEGFRIVDEEGTFRVDRTQTVRFGLIGNDLKNLTIHLDAATKDLTFKTVRDVPKDGSNFAKWFAKECRDLTSVDGTPFTHEPFLIGAYAGLSPSLTADYALHAALKEVADKLGLPVPERTVVIYGAEKKPIYEFFCYPADPKKGPAKGPTP
jgi:hypothetical protein